MRTLLFIPLILFSCTGSQDADILPEDPPPPFIVTLDTAVALADETYQLSLTWQDSTLEMKSVGFEMFFTLDDKDSEIAMLFDAVSKGYVFERVANGFNRQSPAPTLFNESIAISDRENDWWQLQVDDMWYQANNVYIFRNGNADVRGSIRYVISGTDTLFNENRCWFYIDDDGVRIEDE